MATETFANRFSRINQAFDFRKNSQQLGEFFIIRQLIRAEL